MALTGKQAHVLENLSRVQPALYKLTPKVERRRYQLDGRDCTYQITSLVAKGLVAYTYGRPVRLQADNRRCDDAATMGACAGSPQQERPRLAPEPPI